MDAKFCEHDPIVECCMNCCQFCWEESQMMDPDMGSLQTWRGRYARKGLELEVQLGAGA